MRRLVALWGVGMLCVACGGKWQQGNDVQRHDPPGSDSPSNGGGTNSQPPAQPSKACFSIRDSLTATALAQRAEDGLGVKLAPETLALSNADGFARAQQLVDGLEAALRTAPSTLARTYMQGFLRDRLLTSSPLETQPSPTELSESLADAMNSELERVINHWLIGNQATLTALFSDGTSFLNGELANHYGLTLTGSNDWQVLEQDTPERAGVLTLGRFLTSYPSPPSRATRLAAALECTIVPPPPDLASVWANPERPPAKQVVTQAYGEDQAACRTCHRFYIGFGIALDRYDALGRYRDTLDGTPIDTSYQLTLGHAFADDSDTLQVDFANPRELGLALAAAPKVQACFAQKMNESLGGRELSDPELRCVVDYVNQRQTSLWSLLAALAPNFMGG